MKFISRAWAALSGWKTMVFATLVAIGPDALNLIGGFDFTELGLAPGTAHLLGLGIALFRLMSTTPVFSSVREDGGIATNALVLSPETRTTIAETLPDSAKISMAASVPDVAKVVTTPERAKADPSDKVVSQ